MHSEAQYTQEIFLGEQVSWSNMFGKYSRLYPQLKIYNAHYNIEGSDKSRYESLHNYLIYFLNVLDSGPFFLPT